MITFLGVCRCGSITSAARALKVTPSQVSKAVVRLESQLGVTLLSRSTRGVQVSDAGRRLTPQLEELVTRLRALRGNVPLERNDLTVAAPSYLTSLLVPRIAVALPELRVRGLELPPALIRAYAAENFFDLTLTLGDERLPGSWVSTRVGHVRRALFAPPALAKSLGAGPLLVARIRELPFVSPIFNVNGQFVPVDDGCPLGHADRQLGHEAQTLGLALELAARTGQLVYGPVIAARGHLDRGQLVELEVVGWKASDPLAVACNGERVRAKSQRALVAALRQALAELDPR